MYQISKFVKNKSASECFLLRFELKILINCKKKFAITEICRTFAMSTKKESTEEASSWQLFDNTEHRAENVRECCACAWTKCLLAKRFKRTSRVGPWVFRTTREI